MDSSSSFYNLHVVVVVYFVTLFVVNDLWSLITATVMFHSQQYVHNLFYWFTLPFGLTLFSVVNDEHVTHSYEGYISCGILYFCAFCAMLYGYWNQTTPLNEKMWGVDSSVKIQATDGAYLTDGREILQTVMYISACVYSFMQLAYCFNQLIYYSLSNKKENEKLGYLCAHYMSWGMLDVCIYVASGLVISINILCIIWRHVPTLQIVDAPFSLNAMMLMYSLARSYSSIHRAFVRELALLMKLFVVGMSYAYIYIQYESFRDMSLFDQHVIDMYFPAPEQSLSSMMVFDTFQLKARREFSFAFKNDFCMINGLIMILNTLFVSLMTLYLSYEIKAYVLLWCGQ